MVVLLRKKKPSSLLSSNTNQLTHPVSPFAEYAQDEYEPSSNENCRYMRMKIPRRHHHLSARDQLAKLKAKHVMKSATVVTPHTALLASHPVVSSAAIPREGPTGGSGANGGKTKQLLKLHPILRGKYRITDSPDSTKTPSVPIEFHARTYKQYHHHSSLDDHPLGVPCIISVKKLSDQERYDDRDDDDQDTASDISLEEVLVCMSAMHYDHYESQLEDSSFSAKASIETWSYKAGGGPGNKLLDQPLFETNHDDDEDEESSDNSSISWPSDEEDDVVVDPKRGDSASHAVSISTSAKSVCTGDQKRTKFFDPNNFDCGGFKFWSMADMHRKNLSSDKERSVGGKHGLNANNRRGDKDNYVAHESRDEAVSEDRVGATSRSKERRHHVYEV